MKKILGILTVALALCMVFTMVSCGDKPGGSNDITIKFELGTAGTTPVTGTAPADVKLKKGEALAANYPADPTFSGYTFTGWFQPSGTTAITASTVFTESVTLTARWTVAGAQVTITFNANGWTGTGVPTATATTSVGSTYTLPTLVSTDNTQVFEGWALTGNNDGTGGASVGTTTWTVPTGTAATVTLYVLWQSYVPDGSPMTITYNAHGWTGGGIPAQKTFTAGTPYTATELPTLANTPTQTFDGWSTSTSKTNIVKIGDKSPNTSAVTLYAMHTDIGGATGLTINFIPWNGYQGAAITINIGEDVKIADWVNAGGVLPAGPARQGYYFARWEYNGTVVDDTSTVAFSVDDEVTGVYWSTALTALPADDAEKVRLENGGFVIYEFDISSLADDPTVGVTVEDLKKITGITASYKISEAVLNRKPETRFRNFGPYFFNDTDYILQAYDSPVKTRNYWGDFVIDPNGAFVARQEGGRSETEILTSLNKLNPYLINGSTSNKWDDTVAEIQTSAAANEWFDVKYSYDATATGNYSYGFVLKKLEDSKDAHLPLGTSKNKVYFGIGLTTFGEGSKDKPNVDPLNVNDGIVQLIKDVKITTASGTIVGVRPELTVTDKNGVEHTSDQVFAGYIDPVTYLWRGPVTDTITIPIQAYTTSIPCDCAAGTCSAGECGKVGCVCGTDYCKCTTCPVIGKTVAGGFPCTCGLVCPNGCAVCATAEKADGARFLFVKLNSTPFVNSSVEASTGLNMTDITSSYDTTTGKLSASFTESGQRLSLPLTSDQVDKLFEAVSVTVTIVGSATPDNTNFRYHLGNPEAGSGWNATQGYAHNDRPISEIFAGKFDRPDDPATTDVDESATDVPITADFTGNKSKVTLGYFILQNRSSTTVNVDIQYIMITYVLPIDVPPTAATADFVAFKVGTQAEIDAGTATHLAPVKNATAMSGSYPTLTELNDAVNPITFPAGLDIRSYKRFTVVVKYYQGDNATEMVVAPQKQWAQVNIGPGIDHYNLGEPGTVNGGTVDVSIGTGYNGLATKNPITVNFQGRGEGSRTDQTDATGVTGDVRFVELIEFVFFKD